MKIIAIINISIVIVAIYLNYELYTIYNNKYIPAYFGREMLRYQKYRCIRILENNPHLKYVGNNCKKYAYEYLDYKLERSQYIFRCIIYNLILLILFMICVNM